MRLAILLFLLYALPGSAISADPLTIDLDPARSQVQFTLADVLHTVHGTFKLKSGHIEINPQTKAISGQVIVDATSGQSGSDTRDNRMTKNILESDRYPEITFTPTAIDGDLSKLPASVTVTGWFAIHGQRHQMSIQLQATHPGNQAVALGQFLVPYVAWGMQNPSTFVLRVDQEVRINVTAVGSVRGSTN